MVTPLLFPNRLKFFLFFIFSLFLLELSAQENMTEKLVTIKVQDQSLSYVFNLITIQTGLRFSYTTDIIDAERRISLNIINKSPFEALSVILPESLTFHQSGQHIIITSFTKDEFSGSYDFKLGQKRNKNHRQAERRKSNLLISNEEIKLLKKMPISNTGLSILNCHSNIDLKIEEHIMKYQTALLRNDTTLSSGSKQQVPELNRRTISQKDGKNKPFQLTLIYPLGTDGMNSKNNDYNVSVNLFGGITNNVKGAELAGFFNVNQNGISGLQFAGFVNLSGALPQVSGGNNTQIAGAINYNKTGRSAQITGGINVGETGPQISGFINVVSESPVQVTVGINYAEVGKSQFSGVINLASYSYLQMTGGINITNDINTQISTISNIAENSKCQIAGGINVAKKGNTQIVGGINIASESKCQIAGVLNVTDKGRFQLGVINIRDTADGLPIGIINIVKSGGVFEFGIETGEYIYPALTFCSGVDKFYSILSGAYNFSNEFWAFGVGFGTSISINDKVGVNFEIVHNYMSNRKYTYPYKNYISSDLANSITSAKESNYNALVQFKPAVKYGFAKHFKVYAGPTFNFLIRTPDKYYYNNNDKEYISVISDRFKPSYSIWKKNNKNAALDFWIGFTAGIRF